MGLFDRLFGRTEPVLDQEFVRKLIELDERQKAQEKALKALDMEWSEWFDKFRHMYARLSKRIADASKVVGNGSESREDAPETTIEPPPSPGHGSLPPRMYGTGRRNY